MKKLLQNKTFQVAALVVAGLVVVYIAVDRLQLVDRWNIHSAVDDLSHGRHLQQSILALRETPRGLTIEALLDALEDDDGTPWGKANVMQLLIDFKEQRAVRRALESPHPTTRRAAAFRSRGDKAREAENAAIAMEWLNDREAADRRLAVLTIRHLKWEPAVPDLIRVVREEGNDPAQGSTVRQALAALGEFRPDGVTRDIMALAQDTSLHQDLRSAAFEAATRFEDAPRDELRELLLTVARDRANPIVLRQRSVLLLGDPRTANEEVWTELQKLLFDEEEPNEVLQRLALAGLAKSYPLYRLGELLLDRRLATHRFYGVRVDVAAGLGQLRVKQRLALQTLAQLMGDRDENDFDDLVVRTAYLSYWMLTGYAPGISEAERQHFPKRVPARLRDEPQLRYNVFAVGPGAPSVTTERFQATDAFAMTQKDRRKRESSPSEYRNIKAAKEAEARKVQQLMERHVDTAVAQWEISPPRKVEPGSDGEEGG